MLRASKELECRGSFSDKVQQSGGAVHPQNSSKPPSEPQSDGVPTYLSLARTEELAQLPKQANQTL